MRFGLDDQLLGEIVSCLHEEPTLTKALLFGSRARGTERYNSDIDIALYCTGRVPAEFILKIDEVAGIYKVDVIEMGILQNENLRKSIENEGVELFGS